MKAGSTAMTQRPRDRVPSGSMLALPDPRRPERGNPPTNIWWSLFLTALAWSTCTGFPLDRQSTAKVLREFRKRFSTLQIGSEEFPAGQCTSPQLHACHRLFDKDGIKTVHHPTYSPDLPPCDFCLFPKLRGCRYETIEEKKGSDEGHGHAHTRGLQWGVPEVVETVKQEHCSRRSFMCVLAIKMPIRKKSGNLFNDPRIYIYIYIYIFLLLLLLLLLVMLSARISLTLSRHSSLSFITSGRSSGLHLISTQSCGM